MDSMTRVTSKYGPRRRRMHKGIDLKVQIGDTIRAAFDGKVRIKNFERRDMLLSCDSPSEWFRDCIWSFI